MPNLTTTDIPMAMLVILFFWTAIYVFIVIQIKTAIDIHAIHHAPLTEELYSCKLGTFEYFFKSAIGGLLACGLTYTAMVPLDLIKCRMQTNPLRYVRVLQSFRLSVAEGGPRCLATGWVATFIGYSINGMAKFGFYEIFKEYYFRLLGEEHAYLWRTTLYLFASATAEFIAAILLAPMEAVKVRMQTQPQNSPNYVQLPTNSDSTSGILGKLQHSIQLRSAPNSDSFLGTLLHMWDHEGLTGFYKGLVPLWLRQIPYTMMKFASFERVNEFLYTSIIHVPKAQVSKPGQLLITFAAGYIAGMFCAAVSQPADTVVSKLNSQKDLSILDSLKELGFLGVWKGFLPRLIMIGTLTGLQWFIYDSVKVYFRLPRPPPPVMPASLLAKKLL